ncbi:Protein of unknown function [Gryllus bimaculatus]|nr:Protein of unknown function [Gryllus bimaculatus]
MDKASGFGFGYCINLATPGHMPSDIGLNVANFSCKIEKAPITVLFYSSTYCSPFTEKSKHWSHGKSEYAYVDAYPSWNTVVVKSNILGKNSSQNRYRRIHPANMKILLTIFITNNQPIIF